MIADVDKSLGAATMVERMRRGEVRVLARAISLVEDQADGFEDLLKACRVFAGSAVRIGVTGPPGAGKSTLVDQMTRWLRGRKRTVAVVAVDPSSPYTGGALLGDRIRMQSFAEDAGVYLRSMASRGTLGGLARGVQDVCCVMEAAGRETLLIETVGVGQDEVAVAAMADVTVLVLVPGMGDEVQSLKAGVMEVADIFVINKADRDGAERVEQEIMAMQSLAPEDGRAMPQVVRTVALSGEGIEELMAAVEKVLRQKGASEHPGKLVKARETPRLSIDHLGIAVSSIAAARGFYESLGIVVGAEETIEHEQVRTAMLPLGDSRLELLEAMTEDSVIGRFIARRGEGLHHVALRVDDIEEVFARLKAQGTRLASEAVRIGAGGHRYFFVHPASTGGVLLEIVEI